MERHPSLNRLALLGKLAEGLNAEKVERFAKDGLVKTTKTDIDFRTRGFYLALACEINGARSQKVELTGAQGAPLVPNALLAVLAGLDDAALKLLISKLSSAE
jgi:hypothetical protein